MIISSNIDISPQSKKLVASRYCRTQNSTIHAKAKH